MSQKHTVYGPHVNQLCGWVCMGEFVPVHTNTDMLPCGMLVCWLAWLGRGVGLQ